MHSSYSEWLRAVVPTESTFRTKLSELRRVEAVYGDLDELFDADELVSVIEELSYSTSDARGNLPNPSKLEISGDIRNNLASYKSAVQKYVRFRQDVELEAARETIDFGKRKFVDTDTPDDVTFSLEKDLQAVLRKNIEQLESGLTIIDGGVERSVSSGRIDILAEDRQGNTVVIELKVVDAQQKVLGQIASYMGDLVESGSNKVRGIIVAPDFHTKLISACRITPTIKLVRYRFLFSFDEIKL